MNKPKICKEPYSGDILVLSFEQAYFCVTAQAAKPREARGLYLHWPLTTKYETYFITVTPDTLTKFKWSSVNRCTLVQVTRF